MPKNTCLPRAFRTVRIEGVSMYEKYVKMDELSNFLTSLNPLKQEPETFFNFFPETVRSFVLAGLGPEKIHPFLCEKFENILAQHGDWGLEDLKKSISQQAANLIVFPENIQIEQTGRWKTSNKNDFISTWQAIDTDLMPDDADSFKLSLHIQFNGMLLTDAHACYEDNGQMVGKISRQTIDMFNSSTMLCSGLEEIERVLEEERNTSPVCD